MKNDHRSALVRALLIGIAFVGIMAAVFYFVKQSWTSQYQEVRETGNKEFMDEGIVIWNGERYRPKPAVRIYLIGGVDKQETASPVRTSSYRNGGQADFLLLVAVDHGGKKIHQIQIDRDTMAEVTVLGVYGNETGTRELQICLAHSYGSRPDDNARYTVRAVSKLFDGLAVDGYYFIDYTAVPSLTDTLGGVTVTVPEDMTSVNSEWIKGHTVTLKGKDAETFVRTRQTVGTGTNAERMTRQALFMKSAVSQMRQRMSGDGAFVTEIVSTIRREGTTNISEQTLLYEFDEFRDYEVLPIDYFPGEYKVADNGFVEFYPEEGSAKTWIMTHLYEKR